MPKADFFVMQMIFYQYKHREDLGFLGGKNEAEELTLKKENISLSWAKRCSSSVPTAM